MSTLRDPGWCTTDSVLADGGTVHIRPITPEDGAALLAFHARLSDETIHLRYFSNHPHLRPDEVEHFTHVDHDRRMALVGVLHGQIVAVARYQHIADDEAEVAFVVDDAHQGRGLGTLLLEHLAAFARTRGIHRFVADTLAGNSRMRNVFRDAGFVEHGHYEGGVVRVNLDIDPTEATMEVIHRRSNQAAVRSIERLLCPQSIAVVGASRGGDDRARDLPEPPQQWLQRSRLPGPPHRPSYRQCPRLSHRDRHPQSGGSGRHRGPR